MHTIFIKQGLFTDGVKAKFSSSENKPWVERKPLA